MHLGDIYRATFRKIAGRAAHTKVNSTAVSQNSGSNLTALLEEKLKGELPKQDGDGPSIYRIPARLRSVEIQAYEPNIVSIGPYHHGAYRLQAMERIKWNLFQRLFHPSNQDRPDLGAVVNGLKQIEPRARSCYSEEIKFSSDKFIEILLTDSCFVVELLRELKKNDFRHRPECIKRWMLPVLRRDFIMLENQIPLFVLSEVFQLTGTSKGAEPCLKELARQFFEPLMYRDSKDLTKNTQATTGDGESHFLDLFRAGILPSEVSPKKKPFLDLFRSRILPSEVSHKRNSFLDLYRARILPYEVSPKEKPLDMEPHMFRSMAELKECGVKLRKAENCQPLDISFKNGRLKIPPVCLDDYKFTLFRNMMAFEQCHSACKPDVTTYIFFLDRLINSAKDIEILHYEEVLQHSLGGNKNVARLVNSLCKEVAGAVDDSYLHNVLEEINSHCKTFLNRTRAKLKHDYFYNVWVSLSSIAAVVLLYLTILQATYGLGEKDAESHLEKNGFLFSVLETFIIPIAGVRGAADCVSNFRETIERFYSFCSSKAESFLTPLRGIPQPEEEDQ